LGEVKKVKINAYIKPEVQKKFMKKVFQENGKTSGGAISSTVEKALTDYTNKKK